MGYPDEAEMWWAMYIAGDVRPGVLAKMHRCSRTTIFNRLLKCGVRAKPRGGDHRSATARQYTEMEKWLDGMRIKAVKAWRGRRQ